MELKKTLTVTVKPSVKTTRRSIPLTPLDMLLPFPYYSRAIIVYRSPAKGTVIDHSALKESLSKTLVHFYPVAGRLRPGNEQAMEIDCDDAGVLYVEAQAESDLGDFTLSSEMSVLIPTIDNSTQDISSYPLLAVQVTYFSCGGVSIGLSIEHHCMDGSSTFHFMYSWSEIARGVGISVPPFLDRALLIRPRDPPQPNFDHHEFLLLKPTTQISETNGHCLKVSVFKLAKEQIDEMRAKAGEHGHKYSTFEVVAGHIWNCVSKARGLGSDTETILMVPINARFNRWKPALPHNLFGNAVLPAIVVARAGDLESCAAAEIHKTLVRTDSEFVRSTVDCIGLLARSTSISVRPLVYEFDPNFMINSLGNLGKEIDFGWGLPIYLGPVVFDYEKACIVPRNHDGSVSVVIALRPQHMDMFHKLLLAKS